MSDRLVDVEGVGPVHAATLAEQGITTTDDLLERGARPAGRAALAEATGISPTLILEWVNHVDLFRIKGVAGQFADLLEEAGVDTVVELARRNPDNLVTALAEANAAKNLANRLPSGTEVADWIAQAESMPRAVFYDDAPAEEPVASVPVPEAAPAPEPAPAPAPVPEPAPAPVPEPAAAPAAAAPIEPRTAPAPAPAAEPRAFATPTVTQDDRGWLARILDRLRGR